MLAFIRESKIYEDVPPKRMETVGEKVDARKSMTFYKTNMSFQKYLGQQKCFTNQTK